MTEIPQEPESSPSQQDVPPPPIDQPAGSEVPPAPVVKPPADNARTFAILCHLLGFAGLVFPLGNVLAPLVLWLINKQQYPQIDEHGKESVNFQISITIYLILICMPLMFIVVGVFLMMGLVILDVVAIIVASVKASNGEVYRYPLSIRFIK